MTTQLNFGRDVQGFNAFAPTLSDTMYSSTIASGTHEEITVPSSNENWIVIFSYQFGSDIWVSVNNTAAPPAGATFASTTSFLTPAQLKVKAGDTISCYNNNASGQDVGIALYAIP
jgi:hypothetical protein